jgi:hypothetical protein
VITVSSFILNGALTTFMGREMAINANSAIKNGKFYLTRQ